MKAAYLALGSNLGDRAGHLRAAVERLKSVGGITVTAVSAVYETDPVGGPPQDPYLNAVVALATSLDARRLLELARRLETKAGREPDPERRVRWGPRPLDVDLLFVGDDVIDEADLVVPHPRLGERAFVLAPLEDVAPDHPAVVAGRRRFGDGWPGVRRTDVELVSRSVP